MHHPTEIGSLSDHLISKMSVPHIFYQTWKTKQIPKESISNQRKWLDILDAGWKYELLDDADLRKLVEANFPRYLKSYDSFTKNIERVDFARLVMMYLGGVYADLDTYPLQSIDKWVSKGKIVLGREPVEHARDLYNDREIVLCNAFMISPPGKKIWVDLMDYIVANYEPNYKPVYNTGPMAMTLFMEKYPEKFSQEEVIITDPCTFFPMLGNGKFSDRCMVNSELSADTYVVHEWQNTWVVPWYKDPEWFNRRYWFWGMLSLFTIIWLRAYNIKK